MKRIVRCLAGLATVVVTAVALMVATGAEPVLAGPDIGDHHSGNPAPEIEPQDAPIVVDFDRVLPVPSAWRQPIQSAMNAAQGRWPGVSRFTVSAIDSGEGWWHAVLVPTSVIEAHWEVALGSNDVVDVIGIGTKAYVRGTPEFAQLRETAPAVYRLFQPVSDIWSQVVSDMLFPWTSGQLWDKTNGFHETGWSLPWNAIDFSPRQRSNPPVDFAVLAAASGTVRLLCSPPDGVQQALRIEHAGGQSAYLHLDQNTVPGNLINRNVPRGEFLGLLYNGNQGQGPCPPRSGLPQCQYNTRCGYGTGVHLHFYVSERSQRIEGRTAQEIAGGGSGPYRSSNVRGGSGSPPPNCADGEGVILYEHSDYSGRCSRFTGDDNDLSNDSIGNDAASSVRVLGNYEAVLYENTNYGGASSSFTGDDNYLGNDAAGNDRASSIRVRRRDASGTSNCDGGQGAYLYEHPNYGGRCSKFTGDSPNPRAWYIGNDAASSVRVIGNYEGILYQHDDYNGNSSSFISDDPDLSNNPIGNDQASSIRVRPRTATGTSNCDGGNGAYLYEHSNYGGRCSKFTSDSPNPSGWYVGNDSASSIRIIGNYQATVYQNDNYQGASSIFTANDADFGNDSVGNDQASSIRVTMATSGPTGCNDDQFLAEYFNNPDLSGSPIFRRCEGGAGGLWGYDGPGNGVGSDNFSVRWSGRFLFYNEGNYRFSTRTDDGVRLWVDDQLLIDQWRDMAATEFAAQRHMSMGTHRVRMEYYERGGYAVAALAWTLQGYPSSISGDDGRTISYGSGLDGEINPAGDRDDYYFEGSAGQAVTIRLDARNSNLDTFVELYGPNAQLVGQDDDSGEGLNSLLRITLNQNGRHKIIARAWSPSQTGGYRLSLSQEATSDADDGRWIAIGQTLQGTISPSNDRDWYYVSLSSGRTVAIRMNKIDSALDSYLELYNSAGVKVAENDDGGGNRNSLLVYTAPSAGVYRIMGRSWNLGSSGRYNLVLASAANTNLALGGGAWASSVAYATAEPFRVTDAEAQSRWYSTLSDPQLIYVDLGASRTFDQVVLRWSDAFARSYGIYYWAGAGWQNVYWTSSGDGGLDTINFAPVQARFVGMYGTQRGTNQGYALSEFEVYDSSAVLIPLVPPDPGDKGPETDVTPLVPLAPNDPGKATLLVGEDGYGQENTPLAGDPGGTLPVLGLSPTIPTAHLLYPMASSAVFYPQDIVLFQGLATDNDEGGNSITQYEWRSSRDGVLGNQWLFSVVASSLSTGTHVISFRARDDEGDWSATHQVSIFVADKYRAYVPTILKGSTP